MDLVGAYRDTPLRAGDANWVLARPHLTLLHQMRLFREGNEFMPISRRRFLSTAGAAAASLALGVGGRAGADPDQTPPRNYFDLSPLERRAIEADMAAMPTPPVTPIGTDQHILWPFNYKRLFGEEDVPLYNAPNGTPIGTVPAGFNFVSIVDSQDGWVQINHGEWVEERFVSPPVISEFNGVTFDRPLSYSLAWILLDSQLRPHPGMAVPEDTPQTPRYTPVSIFAVQRVGEWDWFLIGPNQWIEQRRVAQALPIEPPEGVFGRWIGVDLFEQVLIAYEDEVPVFATLISSGLPDWPTDEGLYRIDPTHRFVSTPMIGALGGPDSYIIEDIPWTLFFNMFSQEALHGTYWHDGFGYRHSHGCVNMTITDSRWLYFWTTDGYEDAWVYVYYSQPYRNGD